MTSPSVSFRITRSTEDLAHTTHALSQRLVKLEQRLEALELQLNLAMERREERDPQALDSLETVEQLLLDCRLLLGLDQDPPTAAGTSAAAMPHLDSSLDSTVEHHGEPAAGQDGQDLLAA